VTTAAVKNFQEPFSPSKVEKVPDTFVFPVENLLFT
jgi:hypothetical protein